LDISIALFRQNRNVLVAGSASVIKSNGPNRADCMLVPDDGSTVNCQNITPYQNKTLDNVRCMCQFNNTPSQT